MTGQATEVAPTVGDLQVWWIPQVPMPAFHVRVPDLKTAALLVEVLGDYDAFQLEHNVKPDYCNAGGVQRYEDDGEGGFDWFDVDDEEIEEAVAG